MYLLLLLFVLFSGINYAQIGAVTLELSPSNLLITGSSTLVNWRVEQPSDPQNFSLTFVSTCPTRPVPLQAVQPNIAPTSTTGASVTSGSFLVGLCDGDRIENTIYVVAREVTSEGLNFSNTVSVLSDTIPPDPPNINPESDNFPKTVFTQTFQIFGNVDNSVSGGTDKAETAGSVTVFFLDGTDPITGLERRVVLGGGLIQPNSNFVATVDLSTLAFGQQVTLLIVATDPLGQESRPPKTLGNVTRGNGDVLALDNLRLTPPNGSVTRNPGVLVEGTVSGSVAPFAVKVYVNNLLNSEIGGLTSGQGFAHTLNLTTEGNNCIAVEAENGNTPIFRGQRIQVGCITLDTTPPAAPNVISPNPAITLVTRGPEFDLRVITEADSNTTNTVTPKLYLSGPNGITFAPLSPIAIAQGASEQNIKANINLLPDGQHTVELQAEDEVGNTGPGSVARFSFIKDTKSPIVEEFRVNNVSAPQQNPPLFSRSDSIRVSIRLNEPSVSRPDLFVTPHNGSEFAAGLEDNVNNLVFTYSFGVTEGQDGPVRVRVAGGGDAAGNQIAITQNALFFVDTRAPRIRDMVPASFSVLSTSPAQIRLIFEDPLYEPGGTVSGVSPSSAATGNRIELLGPNNQTIEVKVIEFDPVTLDVIPSTPLTLEGNYRIRVRISDKAGNFSAGEDRFIVIDRTRIPEADVTCLPPNGGFSRFGVSPFLDGQAHFVEMSVSTPDFDAQKSSLVLKNLRAIPQTLSGDLSVVSSATIRYTLRSSLPSTTTSDGRYLMEASLFDRSGNRTDTTCTFIYDNCAPSVISVFPEPNSFASRNLRALSAVLKDCLPRFDVEFSDIDLSRSEMNLFKLTGSDQVEKEITSRLRFETLPDQKAQKLLLEIVDANGATSSLPNDGTADGRYRLVVVPVDRSGNRGPASTTVFTLDTQSPILEAEKIKDGQNIQAANISLKGRVRDNNGGSGMQKVEVKVESLAGLTPVTVLLDFTSVFLAGPGIPPFNPDPPYQNFQQDISLNLNATTPGRITLRAWDKAGNYNDFFWNVTLVAGEIKPPDKSAPLSDYSTNLYFVHFAWDSVLEASSYELEIITPNQNSKYYTTTERYMTINLAALAEGEGAYQWTIRSVDALGRKGPKSTVTRFFVDQTKPSVTAIQIQDPSPESRGAITAGITRFLISFSEPVNTLKEPKVWLNPVDVGQFTPQSLEILSFQSTTLLARLKIEPPTATKAGLFGLARITTENIEDVAGNLLNPEDGGINVFEVHSGPYFDFKFFTNPIDSNALTIAVKGLHKKNGLSVDVPAEPAIIAISATNEEIALPALRLTESAFAANLHLSAMNNNSFSLKISGVDKYGNTNTITQFIPISSIYASRSSVLVQPSFSLSVPSESVTQDERIVLVPGSSILASESDELQMVTELPSALHPISLSKHSRIEAKLEATPSSMVSSSTGLFAYRDGAWKFVGKVQSLGEAHIAAQTKYLGPLALMNDVRPPVVTSLGIVQRDRMRFQISDPGSGIDLQNSHFEDNNARWEIAATETADVYEVRVPAHVSSVQGSLMAVDQVGNVSRSEAIALNIQRNFTFQPVVFPNPARDTLNFELNTNFVPDSAEMYVYDAAGKLVYHQPLQCTVLRETYTWDLVNRKGQLLANGIYILRVRALEGGRTHKRELKFAVVR